MDKYSSKIATLLKPLLFPLILILLVGILTSLKLSGSSIGFYNIIFRGQDQHDPNLLFGQPRGIRSDEWLVDTPWAAAQSQVKFAENNDLYLAGQNLIFSNAPVANWTIAFRPTNWSFLLLPFDYAFSLRWWLRSFFLLLAGYLLMMEVSNKNIFASILGACIFGLSPYYQWWYSTISIENIFYAIFIFLFFLRMLRSTRLISLIINTIIFTYFSICFALLFYPPDQISTALFLGFVGIGFLIKERNRLTSAHKRNLLIFASMSLLVIVSSVGIFYWRYKNIIHIVQNTVYPGSRVSVGGDFNPFIFISYFFNIFLMDDFRKIPEFIGGNQSSASGFYLFSLFLLPILIYQIFKSLKLKEQLDPVLLFIVGFYLLALTWTFYGLPSILAKVLLLNYVYAKGMVPVLGFCNFFLIGYFLYKHKFSQSYEYRLVSGIVTSLVFFLVLWAGLYMRIHWPDYINSKGLIFLVAATVGILMALLLLQKQTAFLVLLLLFSFCSTYRVNPVYRGLDVLSSSELSNAIKEIRNSESNNDPWVVYDGNVQLSNYLAANGARVIGGVYYYPNLNFWKNFDPQGRYKNIYNRYAHVVFNTIEKNAISFDLLALGDEVQMNINPCNPKLLNLGIKYFIFNHSVSYSCISFIKHIDSPNMPIFIYKRID